MSADPADYPVVFRDNIWEVLLLSPREEIAILPLTKKCGAYSGFNFKRRQGKCAWGFMGQDGKVQFFDPDHITNNGIREKLRKVGKSLFEEI